MTNLDNIFFIDHNPISPSIAGNTTKTSCLSIRTKKWVWILYSVIFVILTATAITIPMIIILKIKTKTDVSTTIITTTATPDITVTAITTATPDVTTMNITTTAITTNTGKTTTERKVPLYYKITANTKWRKNGITIAGGNRKGNQSNQLFDPRGIHIYDDETIYIADTANNRIMEWKRDAIYGQVVAGGNGRGSANNRLFQPTAVVVDKKTDSLIICDCLNDRLVGWPRQNGVVGTVLLKTACYGLAMDDREYLYIADHKNHVVKRWRMEDDNVTIVAGGNGSGECINQLNYPNYIFVDQNYSIYITDRENNRVMKWEQDAKEGILVAHESNEENEENEKITLKWPAGVFVDHLGHIYIVEGCYHNRITRWLKGTSNASIILGTDVVGKEPYEFDCASHLSFDGEGNIYVADTSNHRVQKFNINSY